VPPRTRITRALALVSIALLAACSRPLDVNGLESQLKRKLERDLGTTGLTVTCPDNVKAEAGSTFTCEASDASGATMVLTITQDDDQGHVSYSIADAST
jgi:hypothetical protein